MDNITFLDTPEVFTKWATGAQRGQKAYYYRGWLMRERMTNHSSRTHGPNAALHFRTCNKAWDFYNLGVVTLVQKRMGDEDYVYMAVKV